MSKFVKIPGVRLIVGNEVPMPQYRYQRSCIRSASVSSSSSTKQIRKFEELQNLVLS